MARNSERITFDSAPRTGEHFLAGRALGSPGQRFRYDLRAAQFLQYTKRREQVGQEFIDVGGTWHLPFFQPVWWSRL